MLSLPRMVIDGIVSTIYGINCKISENGHNETISSMTFYKEFP